MPYCPECAREIPEYVNFCPICGTNIKPPPLTHPPAPSPPTAPVSPSSAPPEIDPETNPEELPPAKISKASKLAAFAGLFLMGIGHLYLGKVRKGAILVAFSLSIWTWLVLLLSGFFSGMLQLPYFFPLAFWIFVIWLIVFTVIVWAWQVTDVEAEARK